MLACRDFYQWRKRVLFSVSSLQGGYSQAKWDHPKRCSVRSYFRAIVEGIQDFLYYFEYFHLIKMSRLEKRKLLFWQYQAALLLLNQLLGSQWTNSQKRCQENEKKNSLSYSLWYFSFICSNVPEKTKSRVL